MFHCLFFTLGDGFFIQYTLILLGGPEPDCSFNIFISPCPCVCKLNTVLFISHSIRRIYQARVYNVHTLYKYMCVYECVNMRVFWLLLTHLIHHVFACYLWACRCRYYFSSYARLLCIQASLTDKINHMSKKSCVCMYTDGCGWMNGWWEQTAKTEDIKFEASPNTEYITDNPKQITERKSLIYWWFETIVWLVFTFHPSKTYPFTNRTTKKLNKTFPFSITVHSVILLQALCAISYKWVVFSLHMIFLEMSVNWHNSEIWVKYK